MDPGLEVEIGCGCGSEEVDASPPCPANASALAYETVVLEYGWLGEQDFEAVSAGSWFDTFQHFDFWHDVGVGFDRARTGSRLTVDVAGLTEWEECARDPTTRERVIESNERPQKGDRRGVNPGYPEPKAAHRPPLCKPPT